MNALPVLAVLGCLAATPAFAQSQSFEVAPFQFVSVSAGITAIITIGAPQSVKAEAPSASVLTRLQVRVTDNRLELGIDWSLVDLLFNLSQHPPIVVHVAAPRILALMPARAQR